MLPEFYRSKEGQRLVTRRILRRDALMMVGELTLASGATATFTQFATNNANPFLNTSETVWEIHDLIPRACLVDANGNPVADPLPDVNFWWRLQIVLTQLNNFAVVKGNQRVAAMVDANTKVWHISGPDDSAPYYFENQCGWVVSAASLVPANGLQLVTDVSLKGYALTLGEEVQDAANEPLQLDRLRMDPQTAPFWPPPEGSIYAPAARR